MYKIFRGLICSFVALLVVIPVPKAYCMAYGNYQNLTQPTSFLERIIELVSPIFDVFENENNNKVEVVVPEERKYVYASGSPVGFSLQCDGVVVVEISSVETPDGLKLPTEKSNIQIGDVLIEIENEKVSNGKDVIDLVNKHTETKKSLNVKLVRNNIEIVTNISPAYDSLTNTYRLGLWIRDGLIGVGTMTYVDENNEFGALGHPVTDIDTNVIIPIDKGEIYKCTIIGIKKGERGIPGELRGLFLKSKNKIGLVNKNNYFGLYGELSNGIGVNYKKDKYMVAKDEEVKIGSAKILTTIDGVEAKYYDIEIIKNNYTNSNGNKCLIIKIVDDELLKVTGGIVQGMSGSPILQEDKIVGCVTHVFINDPTKGFANFISTMQ